MRTLRFCLSICIMASLATHSSAQTRTVKQYSIEQFIKTVNYRGAFFSPDNSKILVGNDRTGVFNAYALPVDGGAAVQLTHSQKESIAPLGYFPKDERFLYTADEGGNELNHVYVRNLDGSVQDLTPGENLKARFFGWSHDGQSFYVTTNERDKRYFDVYEYRITPQDAGPETALPREMIFKNDEGFSPSDISRDGNKLALSKTINRNDSDVYVFDRTDGQTRLITEHEGPINFSPATFSPAGDSIYLLTDEENEFRYLIRQDLESGERTIVEKPAWDVTFASFSKQGTYLMTGVNEDGRTVFNLYHATTMQPVELPTIADTSLQSARMSDDEQHLAVYVSGGKTPNDLYYINLDAKQPVQLATSLNPEIDPVDLVAGEVMRFVSFDGVEIPGILYRPHQASPTNRVPGLVWVHGGPGGQSRIGYRDLLQYLVNHGYMIYAINNRGSSGYGKTFQQMDDQKHGEGDLMDCVTSKQMLEATGVVDPEPDRDHRRQLRRVHGPGSFGFPA